MRNELSICGILYGKLIRLIIGFINVIIFHNNNNYDQLYSLIISHEISKKQLIHSS